MAETQPFPLQGLCYTAGEFREGLADQVCGEGVVDVSGGDLLVTTGGNDLDLFVAAGSAYVLNNESTGESQMYRVLNDAQVTLVGGALPGVLPADGTDPRIDTVVGTVSDAEYAGGTDTWSLNVVGGTPTAGATLTNLNGAAAVPDNSVVLAYILVPATFTGPFVNATHILDVRNNYFKCGTTPWVSLEASAATSSGNAVFTQTTLATSAYRDRDYFTVSGSTITVVQAGIYDVNAMVGFVGITSVGTARFGRVYKNNTNLPNAAPDGMVVADGSVTHDSGEAASGVTWSLSRQQLSLAANDTLKLCTFHDVGSAQNTFHSAGVFVAHLTVRKVG